MHGRTRTAVAALALAGVAIAACTSDAGTPVGAPSTSVRDTGTLVTPSSSVGVTSPTATPTSASVPSPMATPSVTAAPAPESVPSPMATPSVTAAPAPESVPDPVPRAPVGRLSLEIPAADVSSTLVRDGLDPRGRVVPEPGTVMWFDGFERVRPGHVGTSVIAGHVVAGGRPDVFNQLEQLADGDEVTLTGEDGGAMAFRVVSTRILAKNELPHDRDVWGSNTTVPRLAIITCDDTLGFRDDGHRVANFVAIAEPA